MATYGHRDSWLLPLLSAVKVRPGAYMGDEKVATLATYLRGYVQAREDIGALAYGDAEKEVLSDFGSWLARRIGSKGRAPWYAHIREVDDSDRSIRTFFALFEAFLAESGLKLLDPDDAMSRWPAHSWADPPRALGAALDEATDHPDSMMGADDALSDLVADLLGQRRYQDFVRRLLKRPPGTWYGVRELCPDVQVIAARIADVRVEGAGTLRVAWLDGATSASAEDYCVIVFTSAEYPWSTSAPYNKRVLLEHGP